MQVVPIETRELTTSATQLRQGVIKAYRLIEGEPGLGNFALRLVNIAGDFLSPRHRHNFDQFRMQLEGTYDYGPDGKFTPGSVGSQAIAASCWKKELRRVVIVRASLRRRG